MPSRLPSVDEWGAAFIASTEAASASSRADGATACWRKLPQMLSCGDIARRLPIRRSFTASRCCATEQCPRAAEASGAPDMSTLRIVDDTIEMDQRAVATLVPGLQLSLRDQLIAIFDAANEDAEYILELEDRVATGSG